MISQTISIAILPGHGEKQIRGKSIRQVGLHKGRRKISDMPVSKKS